MCALVQSVANAAQRSKYQQSDEYSSSQAHLAVASISQQNIWYSLLHPIISAHSVRSHPESSHMLQAMNVTWDV